MHACCISTQLTHCMLALLNRQLWLMHHCVSFLGARVSCNSHFALHLGDPYSQVPRIAYDILSIKDGASQLCSVVSRQQWSTSFLLFPDSNDRHPFWRACRKLQISSMWWTPTSLYDILLRWASIAVSNLLDMSSSPLASWPLNQVCVAWLWYQPPCTLAANQKRPGRPSRTSNWLIYCISHHQTCQRSLMLCNSNELVEDGWLLLHVLS